MIASAKLAASIFGGGTGDDAEPPTLPSRPKHHTPGGLDQHGSASQPTAPVAVASEPAATLAAAALIPAAEAAAPVTATTAQPSALVDASQPTASDVAASEPAAAVAPSALASQPDDSSAFLDPTCDSSESDIDEGDESADC